MSKKRVIARMDAILLPLGFVRHKATWNRSSGLFVDVIDVQISSSIDSMTINAGVLHLDVYKLAWGTEPPAVIEEPDCIVRARVGQLIDNKDLWWQLDDSQIVDDVAEKVTALVLPFLEPMHSFDAMQQFVKSSLPKKQRYPLPIIYLAILMSEQGDRAGACRLLTDFGKKTVEGWRTRIGEVAERLGCS